MNEEAKSFAYSYSAKEQEEIKRIRNRYVEKHNTKTEKMELLRSLDAGVTKKATISSILVGLIGTLILGTGMSLIMTDLGAVFAISHTMVLGIVMGVVGILGIAFAYPIYNYVTKKERERIAPEIIRLTDELMK